MARLGAKWSPKHQATQPTPSTPAGLGHWDWRKRNSCRQHLLSLSLTLQDNSSQNKRQQSFINADLTYMEFGIKTLKRNFTGYVWNKNVESLAGFTTEQWKNCLLKFQPARPQNKKVSRLKNTNNHALKHLPFFEGKGFTSGFIKTQTACD